jgi:poly-gamma-glutamate capsule biosynthesis protein CapA/YwtB (metallophosphatase superfamily)
MSQRSTSQPATMMAVGDLIIDYPEVGPAFEKAAPLLRTADIVVGHLEGVFTERGVDTGVSIMSQVPFAMKDIKVLAGAGFNVCAFAGNHTWGWGIPGIKDTIEGLAAEGISAVGGGMNIAEARRPVILEQKGTRFGFLNYNCVGPRGSWATPGKPGCAYVQIISHYEMELPNPGGAPSTYTFAEPESLKEMMSDINRLRPQCDVLVVTFHKGIISVPVAVAMYEGQIAHAAIDAGADAVWGNHSHMLKGIEEYKGKFIFHNLGTFVAISSPPLMNGSLIPEAEVGKKGAELFGYMQDPDDPEWRFHPDAKKTVIVKYCIENGKISKISCIPCLINKQRQPEVLKKDARGALVFDYLKLITEKAGFDVKFKWDGDEIVVFSQSS